MKHLDLFSGIGGFALAAKWMGWKTVQFVEIDRFCQKVLKKNFPQIPIHENVKTFDGTPLRGTIDIITGGFPCQPFSLAGKRKGVNDERHLWPEMLRIIREVQPTFIVGENVFGILNWSKGMVFESVCSDLEAEGYEITPFILPACGINAPHKRDRVWFIAHSNIDRNRKIPERIQEKSEGKRVEEQYSIHRPVKPNNILELCSDATSFGRIEGNQDKRGGNKRTGTVGQKSGSSDGGNVGVPSNATGFGERKQDNETSTVTNERKPRKKSVRNGRKRGVADADFQGLEVGKSECYEEFTSTIGGGYRWEGWPTEPAICGRNDGVPHRVDRLKSLGNAIVPQIAFEIFQCIEEMSSVLKKLDEKVVLSGYDCPLYESRFSDWKKIKK